MEYLISNYELDGYQKTTIDQAIKYLSQCKVIGFDTETTGLDPHTNKIIMIQVGDLTNQYVIDVRCVDPKPLKDILESNKIQKIGVNLGFDYKMILGNYGWRCKNLNDLMINEMVIMGGYTRHDMRKAGYKLGYSMAALAKRYLNIDLQSNQLSLFPDLVAYKDTGKEFVTHTGPFTSKQVLYGTNDVKIPLMIWAHQRKRIEKEDLELIRQLENHYLIPSSEMEFNGAYIDPIKWDKTYHYYSIKKGWAKFELYCLLSNIGLYDEYRGINWRSTKQVIKLFNQLGIDTKILDKKKSRDQGEEVWKNSLEKKYLKKKKNEHPIVELYLSFKEYDKLTNTYGHKFLRHINEKTNRLHTSYWQMVKTGRSSSSPNLQNIPRGALHRRCFTNQYTDTILVVGDYNGQELRIVADKSCEKAMIDEFVNGGDVHALTASTLYGRKITKDNPKERYNGKVFNFATIYGASPKALSENLDIPLEEAKRLSKNYFKGYKKIDLFLKGVRARALKHGVIDIDPVTKRKHWHLYQKQYEELEYFIQKWKANGWEIPPKINSWYWSAKGKIERDAGNYVIQGTAASMTKLALIYFFTWIKTSNLLDKVWLVNVIHDEIVVECKVDLAEEVRSNLKRCMESAGSRFCKVPIIADPKITKVWDH